MKKPRKPRAGRSRKSRAVAPPQPVTIPQMARKTVIFWVGIVLAGLAVYAGIQDFFEVADLVRTVTWKWDSWNHYVWAKIMGYEPDKFPPGFATRLTFLVAITIIGFSAFFQSQKQNQGVKPRGFWNAMLQLVEELIFVKAFAVTFVSVIAVNALMDVFIFNTDVIDLNDYWAIPTFVGLVASITVLLLVWFHLGIYEVVHSLVLVVFITGFYFALAFTGAASTIASGPDAVFIYREILIKSNYFGFSQTATILLIAPPKYFNMVFVHIIIFVMLIVLLNYAIILKESVL